MPVEEIMRRAVSCPTDEHEVDSSLIPFKLCTTQSAKCWSSLEVIQRKKHALCLHMGHRPLEVACWIQVKRQCCEGIMLDIRSGLRKAASKRAAPCEMNDRIFRALLSVSIPCHHRLSRTLSRPTDWAIIAREFAFGTRPIKLDTADAAHLIVRPIPSPVRNGVPFFDPDLHDEVDGDSTMMKSIDPAKGGRHLKCQEMNTLVCFWNRGYQAYCRPQAEPLAGF